MKICLIGPGIISIPPNGHGAVESLIYEHFLILSKLGHEVKIVNTPNVTELVNQVNDFHADITHCHYDCFNYLLPSLNSSKVVTTSHYPYIDQLDRHAYDNYGPIFKMMIENCEKFPIFADSEKDRNTFVNWGANPNYVHRFYLGASSEKIRFTENPQWSDRTLCLAKIEPRKRQFLTSKIDSVYYMGRGPMDHPNYVGEVTDEYKYTNLTEYGNMVLLSLGENGTCLAVKEGLMAGLGVVCTEAAASELTWDAPFIDILTEREIFDPVYVESVITRNREKSLKMRKDIRAYGETWSWNKLVTDYADNLKVLLHGKI